MYKNDYYNSGSTNLCEQTFSLVKSIEKKKTKNNKYRNRLSDQHSK